jgi:hypothetical protein
MPATELTGVVTAARRCRETSNGQRPAHKFPGQSLIGLPETVRKRGASAELCRRDFEQKGPVVSVGVSARSYTTAPVACPCASLVDTANYKASVMPWCLA